MGHITPHTGFRGSVYMVWLSRYIKITYAFARKIKLLFLHLWEDFQELLHKSNHLSCKTVFILVVANKYHVSNLKYQIEHSYIDIGLPLWKSSANGLFNPQNTWQVGPTEFVRCGFRLTHTPREWLTFDISSKAHESFRRKSTPFSCKSPSRDEHPGPPFVLKMTEWHMLWPKYNSHQKIKSSSEPCGPGGKNQKKSYAAGVRTQDYWEGEARKTCLDSFLSPLIGKSPDQLGPTSKSTSGMLFPSTKNSKICRNMKGKQYQGTSMR